MRVKGKVEDNRSEVFLVDGSGSSSFGQIFGFVVLSVIKARTCYFITFNF